MKATAQVRTRLGELAAGVRQFTRFYTRFAGVFQPGYLGTRFSVTQARIIYEVAQNGGVTASQLAKSLGVDSGYLSRILSGFEREGLLERSRSKEDRRQRPLELTNSGKREFRILDSRSQTQIEDAVRALTPGQQTELVRAMGTIEGLLGGPPHDPIIVLRAPRPGDFGWVVERHGTIYAEEYGWDETFEGLVARIVADFVNSLEDKRQRCWIADRGGENVGCVFLTRRSVAAAQLRLLLVERSARRNGLGARLIEECIQFARQAGYKKIVLWTNSVLKDAARLYERAGFHLVSQKKHRSFGHALVGQTWERTL